MSGGWPWGDLGDGDSNLEYDSPTKKAVDAVGSGLVGWHRKGTLPVVFYLQE